MKLPRDVSGEELAKLLERYDFQITRQTGSHMRLITIIKGEYQITIPKHKSLKIGTLSCILTDIANYLKINKQSLIEKLWN
ncbi:MAG: type II toxin-antitoxin system HicA family toxin [Nitrospirota bacterium]